MKLVYCCCGCCSWSCICWNCCCCSCCCSCPGPGPCAFIVLIFIQINNVAVITANNGHDADVDGVADDGRRIERSIRTLNIVWSVIIHRLSLLRYSSTHLWLFVYEPLPQTVNKAIDFHSIYKSVEDVCLCVCVCESNTVSTYFCILPTPLYAHSLFLQTYNVHTRLPAKTINMNEFISFLFTSFALCLFFLSAYEIVMFKVRFSFYLFVYSESLLLFL